MTTEAFRTPDLADLADLVTYFRHLASGSDGSIALLDRLDTDHPEAEAPNALTRQLSKKYAAGRGEAYRDAAEKLQGLIDSALG